MAKKLQPASKVEPKVEKRQKAQDPGTASSPSEDPALRTYAEALNALYRQDWETSARLFENVVRDGDRPDLAERARQLLAVSRQRQNGGAAGKEADEGDPYLCAVVAKNRGDLAGALALCREAGRETKDDRFAYLAAAVHALENRTDEAARALSRAVELNSKNRVHAYHDADFADLRKHKDHRQLFELP
jgi:tetratricopeptide (TPR) repeat protein